MTSTMRTEPSGWVIFAATILWVVAVFNIIYGLTALFNSDWLVFTPDGVYWLNITTWGWILLLTGLIQGAVGVGVFYGMTWARALGIIMAALNAISVLSIMALYPLWGVVILAINVFIIYGLAVHGAQGAPRAA